MVETSQVRQRNRPLPFPPPLDEIYRRIVRAHASLAEVVGDDPERRGWVLNELMETLRYIERVGGEHAASQ